MAWLPNLILCLALFSGATFGEVQFDSSQLWKTAQPLASGQQVLSIETSYQNISNRFSPGERLQPLGEPYTRALTWGQLLNNERSGEAKADLQDYMKSRGIGANDIAATSNYQVDMQQTAFAINWSYGLTRAWMIGVQIPMTYRVTTVRNSVSVTPQLGNSLTRPQGKSILGLSDSQLHDRVQKMAEEQLAGSGYDAIPEQNRLWSWGDISLINGFNLVQTYSWSWSVQQMLRFPTSQNNSVSDYIHSSMDEGQVDLGVSSLTDFRWRRWTLGARLGFVSQLPDTLTMRVPDSNGADGSVDYRVKRDLGDWAWGAGSVNYRVTSNFNMNVEHDVLSKGKDRYSGELASASSYGALAKGTDERLSQTRVGFDYRLPEGSRAGVRNMWVASVGYTWPWIGANAVDASRASVELTNYF